eukprot:gene5473-6634_t
MEGLFDGIPISILTDSYKAGHNRMYPSCTKMVAYGEFRKGFKGKHGHDTDDTRLVVYGIRYIVETFISKKWTMEDIETASLFFSTHNAPMFTEYPFPKELFEKFVRENDGYFPVKLEALPEGSVVHVHIPVYQITAEDEYAPLCTFLETLLTQIWYPSTVATLSRRCKDIIEEAFEKTVDGGKLSPLLGSRLHDFGFRGCTCVEQSVLGGVAHLLNFDGTDTLSAAYYAQFKLNGGTPVGQSIPATEHSVMTSWRTEQAAIENMIENFGEGLFACVMDSYDYSAALRDVLPAIREKKVGKGGFMVLRPDSGDPVEAVLEGLRAADKVFGSEVNSKGYKVINGAGVIQGDGINIDTLRDICTAVEEAGYSLQCVAFGMGGGLLQSVNRDTMSFATKLSHIRFTDGTSRDIMKAPKTDLSKFSLPGILAVKREEGVPMVYCTPDAGAGEPLVAPEENLLQVVYDKRPLAVPPWESFSEVRSRLANEWAALPPCVDVLTPQIKGVIRGIREVQAR